VILPKPVKQRGQRPMDTTDRSSVIRLVDAEARIPGPAGERAVLVLQRGTLDITLSIPIPPNHKRHTNRTSSMSSFAAVAFSSTMTNGTDSIQATSCSWPPASSIITRTSAMIWLCGAYSMAVAVAKSPHSRKSPATSPGAHRAVSCWERAEWVNSPLTLSGSGLW
jgi:hypothetical protein